MEVRKVTRELSEKNEELSESKMSLENQKVWTSYHNVYCIVTNSCFKENVLNLVLFNASQLNGGFDGDLRRAAVSFYWSYYY